VQGPPTAGQAKASPKNGKVQGAPKDGQVKAPPKNVQAKASTDPAPAPAPAKGGAPAPKGASGGLAASYAIDVLSIGLLVGMYAYAWNETRITTGQTLEIGGVLPPMQTTFLITFGVSSIALLALMMIMVLCIIDRILVSALWHPGNDAVTAQRHKYSTVSVAFAWIVNPQLALAFVTSVGITATVSFVWLQRLSMRRQRPTRAQNKSSLNGMFIFNLAIVISVVILQSVLSRRWDTL
jgi:hypothetical protein